MKKSVFGAVLVGTACVGLAAAVAVGFREVGGIDVAAEESQTVDGKLMLSPQGTFYKTGAGTLTVPSTAVDSPNGYSLNVLKGKMVLRGAGAKATANAPAAAAKAAICSTPPR